MNEGYTPEISMLGTKGLARHVYQFRFVFSCDYIQIFPAARNQQHDEIQVIKDIVDPEN